MNVLNATSGLLAAATLFAAQASACETCGTAAAAESQKRAEGGHGQAHAKPAEIAARDAGEATHGPDGHDHEPPKAEEDAHAHGEACDHEHEAAAKPAADGHAHGAACDHDHETAAQPAAEHAAEAGHAHGAACDHGQEAGTAAADTPGALAAFEVPESAQRLLGLTLVKAEKRRVEGARRFPGRFEWMPGARRVYVAAVAGAVEVRVRPPQRVKAGEVLFTVRSPEWVAKKAAVNEAEAALSQVQAEAGALRRRLDQLKAAEARNAELEQQLAAKEAEAVRAERTRQNAEEALRAVLALCRQGEDGALVVEARTAGVVERVSVENGAWAEAGAEVVRVAREDGLWFRADGLLSEMTRVRTGQSGAVEPLGRDAGEAAAGAVELGLAADAAARIQPLYLLPKALPAWAAPGRAGVLSVTVEESAPSDVALPPSCIVADGLKRVVFVRDEQDRDRFLKVEVALGASDGDWVAVKGLREGAEVVREGAYELKLAAPEAGGQKKAAGHFHADGQFHEGTH